MNIYMYVCIYIYIIHEYINIYIYTYLCAYVYEDREKQSLGNPKNKAFPEMLCKNRLMTMPLAGKSLMVWPWYKPCTED